MHYSLSPNYVSRLKFVNPTVFSDSVNFKYLRSVAGHLFDRVNNSARPHHIKYNGVKNNGARGKEVLITKEDILELLIQQNGICAGTGKKMYFGDVNHMFECSNEAIKAGLMTEEDNWNKPSIDRISSGGDYSFDNIQITTIGYNLGTGSTKKMKKIDFVEPNVVEIPIIQTIITFGSLSASFSRPMTEASASFLATYSKSIQNNQI